MKEITVLRLPAKLIFALTIVLSIVFINSCKKNVSEPALQESTKISPDIADDCEPGYYWDPILRQCVPYEPQPITVIANPNNPNEVVGQKHNAGMGAIMPYYSDGSLQPTEENVLTSTRSFLLTRGYDTITFNNSYNYEKQLFGSTILHQTDISAIANQLYSQGIISVAANNYLSQLANYISSFTSDSISIPTQSSYNSFANNLITNENQFSGNSSLTTNDKYVLFSAYSVARYSTVYAINYSIQLPQGTTRWFSWKSVGKADISGAVGGAAGGAIVGAWAGGVGAGPGAIIGGVGGGVANSVTNAVEQILNHLF